MNAHLDFSYNWNNKLDCEYFTTIRRSGLMWVGQTVDVYLKGSFRGPHIIVEKKALKIGQINPFIAGLDTGYSVEETKKVLKTMYKELGDHDTVHLYLVRKLKKEEIQSVDNQTALFE